MLLFLYDIKQSDLAIKLGVSQPTLSNYTKLTEDYPSVNFELLENLAAYFNKMLDLDLEPLDIIREYDPEIFLIQGINA